MTTTANPIRTFTVDFTLDQLKTATKRLPNYNPNIISVSSNEVFNIYSFNSGKSAANAMVKVQLTAVDKGKTEITIEPGLTRSPLTPDSMQLEFAYIHIENFADGLAALLSNPDAKFDPDKKINELKAAAKSQPGCGMVFTLCAIVSALFLLHI